MLLDKVRTNSTSSKIIMQNTIFFEIDFPLLLLRSPLLHFFSAFIMLESVLESNQFSKTVCMPVFVHDKPNETSVCGSENSHIFMRHDANVILIIFLCSRMDVLPDATCE